MKIAIDARRFRDFGIGTYIRNLLSALAVEDQSNQYLVICRPADVSHLDHLPKNFQAIPYARSDRDPRDHFFLPLFLRKLKPDLIHYPFNRVPLLSPTPYVVTIHDLSSLLFGGDKGYKRSLRQFRFRWAMSRARCVIAVSSATRRDVQNLFGVPESRVRLVYNAPGPEFFTHRTAASKAALVDRQRIIERYQITYPFLLYAGTIRPQKNIPRLVEAFAVARAELEHHPAFHDLRLILIGDDISHYPSVRRAVIQSRVEHAVRFLGFVPFETLRVFYELAAAFVFPSLYEGFGLAPLEAMASGTPVIASNIGALPEAVGDAAMLVNPENVFDIARGIRELLLDDELRDELIARGSDRAASFSWSRTACQVLEIYRSAVKRSAP